MLCATDSALGTTWPSSVRWCPAASSVSGSPAWRRRSCASRPATERDKGKAKKKQEFIWCEGEVIAVTPAEKVKITPQLKKEDIAGETAVRIKWPEDPDHDEPEQSIWTVLKPKDFGEQVHLGWRYAASSIQRLACAREQQCTRTAVHL